MDMMESWQAASTLACRDKYFDLSKDLQSKDRNFPTEEVIVTCT